MSTYRNFNDSFLFKLQELFLPANAHVNSGNDVTLVSDMDEDTLLWAQVASSFEASLDGLSPSSAIFNNSITDVSPDIVDTNRSSSSVGVESIDIAHRQKSRRSSAGESSGNIFADVSVPIPGAEGKKELDDKQVETEGPQIVAVAGLKSLSKGDVLSLHLIDRMGRNICMVRGDTNRGKVEGNPFRGQGTVFGDSCDDVANKGKSSFLPSLPSMESITRIPPQKCSMM